MGECSQHCHLLQSSIDFLNNICKEDTTPFIEIITPGVERQQGADCRLSPEKEIYRCYTHMLKLPDQKSNAHYLPLGTKYDYFKKSIKVFNHVPFNTLAQKVDHANFSITVYDQHSYALTIDQDSIVPNVTALLITSSVNEIINNRLLDLFEKHRSTVKELVIFTKDSASTLMIRTLIAQRFPDFADVVYIEATDAYNVTSSCCAQLKNAWDTIPPYIVITHWKPSLDIITKAFPENYCGAELRPFTSNERSALYNDPNSNSQVLLQLRGFAVTLYEHTKN